MPDEIYIDSIKKWRHEYAQKLLSQDGWLSISGLFWLEEGPNRFGAGPSNSIILPPGPAPDFAGTFFLQEGKITLHTADQVEVIIGDQKVTTSSIVLGSYGSSEWILLNELKLSVIQRGTRFGVRVYDKNNPAPTPTSLPAHCRPPRTG
jgi:hypothetical protein